MVIEAGNEQAAGPYRIFMSYPFGAGRETIAFVLKVHFYLAKQPNIQPYAWDENRNAKANITQQLTREIRKSNAFVLFASGEKIGPTQFRECGVVPEGVQRLVVLLPGAAPKNDSIPFEWDQLTSLYAEDLEEKEALRIAMAIMKTLKLTWIIPDDIPDGYLFSYEKTIIAHYISETGIPEDLLQRGCPQRWPKVEQIPLVAELYNPVDEDTISSYRDGDDGDTAQVVAAALTKYHTICLKKAGLTFPEAGPRRRMAFPKQNPPALSVGVLVSGGIAPGINAVIEGIVERHLLYAQEANYSEALQITGFRNGFNGLIELRAMTRGVDLKDTKADPLAGGSMLGTSREATLGGDDPKKRRDTITNILNRLYGVDILYVIGGDGSMRAAHAIWKAAQATEQPLSVVAVPKTMDNDILWVWQSFGFLSAVEKGTQAVRQLHTEVKSNPRLCIVQLFGSDSGFVASHVGLASGVCDAVLIPEVKFKMSKLLPYIISRLLQRKQKEGPYGLILMAETAIPEDIEDYIDRCGLSEKEKEAVAEFLRKDRRVYGQTPDALRSAGLKVVSTVLQEAIKATNGLQESRVFANEPRHLLRSIEPSCSDIVFGQRLGALAVDCAMAGYTDFMISQWLTEFVMVPLRLVILGRKRIPENGIFWRSVRARTGQPDFF